MYARMHGQGIQLLATKRLFKLLETVGPWPEPYTVACTFRTTPQLRASVRREPTNVLQAVFEEGLTYRGEVFTIHSRVG